MIDYWKLTKDYKIGDAVQKMAPDWASLSPFVGKVTAVHPGIGFCDVQWPFGIERISPEELVKVNPALMRYLPPTLDQSYSTVEQEIAQARTASKKLWRTTEVPPGFHRDLAQMWSVKANEVAAYDELWHRYATSADDASIRDEVAKFYQVASGLAELRIQQAATKTAAYWAAQNRKFRVTQQELQNMTPSCPKCGTPMRKTTYKMHKGTCIRLFACPNDLYLLKRDDLLAPDGGPVVW